MANNIISARLVEGADNESLLLKANPCDDQMEHYITEARDHATKLDRLVAAAREAKKILNHDGGTTHDAATRYGCATELAAALADIELPTKE